MHIFGIYYLTLAEVYLSCALSHLSVSFKPGWFYSLANIQYMLMLTVQPQRPRIEYNATQVAPGQNVSARAGERAILRCISRYGNPPARIKWMLGKLNH
jgi:hypothetical protein